MPAAAMIATAKLLRLLMVATASAPDVLIFAAVHFDEGKSDGALFRNLPLANHDCQTTPSTISASGRGGRRPASADARCKSASLSDTAGTFDRRLCRRRPLRHQRTTDRAMVVGAARSIIHYRESTGRRRQSCDRNGRARAPRWLHAARNDLDQRVEYRTLP